MMKTARFAAVVEAAGKPDTHLLLVSPEKDKALQAAIRTHRVMTVHQELVGNNADHGAVDFEPGGARTHTPSGQALRGVHDDVVSAGGVRNVRRIRSRLIGARESEPSKAGACGFGSRDKRTASPDCAVKVGKARMACAQPALMLRFQAWRQDSRTESDVNGVTAVCHLFPNWG